MTKSCDLAYTQTERVSLRIFLRTTACHPYLGSLSWPEQAAVTMFGNFEQRSWPISPAELHRKIYSPVQHSNGCYVDASVGFCFALLLQRRKCVRCAMLRSASVEVPCQLIELGWRTTSACSGLHQTQTVREERIAMLASPWNWEQLICFVCRAARINKLRDACPSQRRKRMNVNELSSFKLCALGLLRPYDGKLSAYA